MDVSRWNYLDSRPSNKRVEDNVNNGKPPVDVSPVVKPSAYLECGNSPLKNVAIKYNKDKKNKGNIGRSKAHSDKEVM